MKKESWEIFQLSFLFWANYGENTSDRGRFDLLQNT